MQRDIGFIASSNDKWTGEMERRLARLFGERSKASFAYLPTYPKGLFCVIPSTINKIFDDILFGKKKSRTHLFRVDPKLFMIYYATS